MKRKIRIRSGQLLTTLWQRFAPSALVCMLLTAAAIAFSCISQLSLPNVSDAINTFFSYTFYSLGMSLLFATAASVLCERYDRPKGIAWIAAALGAGCGALMLYLYELDLKLIVSIGSIMGGIVLCLLALCFHAVSHKDAPSVRLLHTGCWFLAAFGIGCLSAMFLNLCGSAIFALLLQNASYNAQTIFTTTVMLTSFLLIAPWVFLGGLPRKEITPDKRITFFSAIVLLPLYLLFVGILLVYVAKIAITFTMPVGVMNGYSIAALTVFAFFNLTLTGDEDRLSVWFKKWGALLMLPIIATQFIAVWMRVSAYGLTESRTMGIIWTLMCIAVVITALFRKRANWFFLAAAVVSVVIFCTPLTARNIAIMNQESRLYSALERNNMIDENGEIAANPDAAAADQKIIYSTVDYLENVKNPRKGSVTELLHTQTEKLAENSGYSRRSSYIKQQLLGFEKPQDENAADLSKYYRLYGSASETRLDTRGYVYAELITVSQHRKTADSAVPTMENADNRFGTTDLDALFTHIENCSGSTPLTIDIPVTFMIDGEEADLSELLSGIILDENDPILPNDTLILPSGKKLHFCEIRINDYSSSYLADNIFFTAWLLTPEE